jgi:hypothetical protein
LLIFRGCQVTGHRNQISVGYHKSVDFISKSLQLLKHVKRDVSASEQHPERAANSLSYELGRFDSDTGLFPWSGYRTLPHFFLRPRIQLVIDDYRKEQWKHDVPLFQYSLLGQARQPIGNVRQITIVVFNRGGHPLEKASLHVHILKKRHSFARKFIIYLTRKWEFLPDVTAAWDKEPNEIVIDSPTLSEANVSPSPAEVNVAGKVRTVAYTEYKLPIESKYERVAVVAFAIQGHANAYLSDLKVTPLPMGTDHSLLITVSGRNMVTPTPRRYTLSLKDWEHLSLKET